MAATGSAVQMLLPSAYQETFNVYPTLQVSQSPETDAVGENGVSTMNSKEGTQLSTSLRLLPLLLASRG